MRRAIALVIFVVLVVAGILLMIGPRMYDQPHVRAFQAAMPLPPPGTVPVEPSGSAVPSAEQAATLANPLPATPENVARGKVYYQYYSAFCHGDRGAGDGPVGQSYVPVPADLRSDKTRALNDGQLLRAMLTGTGHEPVLEYTVLPLHRWYVVLYVRSLRPDLAQPSGKR